MHNYGNGIWPYRRVGKACLRGIERYRWDSWSHLASEACVTSGNFVRWCANSRVLLATSEAASGSQSSQEIRLPFPGILKGEPPTGPLQELTRRPPIEGTGYGASSATVFLFPYPSRRLLYSNSSLCTAYSRGDLSLDLGQIDKYAREQRPPFFPRPSQITTVPLALLVIRFQSLIAAYDAIGDCADRRAATKGGRIKLCPWPRTARYASKQGIGPTVPQHSQVGAQSIFSLSCRPSWHAWEPTCLVRP